MRASIIIPAFNEEATIAQAIQAALAQTHRDLEVIVIDNASTDRTAEVARSFPGVTVLQEEHKGTMWACERGRLEAAGAVIVRMDADCLPDPDWLARGLKHFEDKQVVVVSGPYDYYDHPGRFRNLALYIQKRGFSGIHKLFQALKLGGITMGGNTFIRASALADADGFNTDITFYGDDTDVPKRLSRYGKCLYDPSLVIKTSARRFAKEGILFLQAKYTFHFLKVIFSRGKKAKSAK